MWLGSLVAVLAAIAVGAANSIPGIIAGVRALQQNGIDPGYALVAFPVVGSLVLLCAVVAGGYVLSYKNMSYVFDEREFSFYSGIITKRRVHLPYARVQSVNHNAPIVVALVVGLTALGIVVTAAFMTDGISRAIALMAAPVTLASVAISWLVSALGTAVSYGNFRARRRGSRIEVEHGLLPEFADLPSGDELSGLPSVALRRSILRRCVWYNVRLYCLAAVGVAAILLSGVPGGIPARASSALMWSLAAVAVCCVVNTVLQAFGAVLWARKSGYAWNRGYLMLHNDGISVARVVVPRQKIQSGSTRSNPFQRRLSLTGIVAVTAAGTRSTSSSLIDVPEEVGAAYLDWLKPRRGQRQSQNAVQVVKIDRINPQEIVEDA